MKQVTSFMILVAFSLVLDRSFNSGGYTLQLAETADTATTWALNGGEKVARTVAGF